MGFRQLFGKGKKPVFVSRTYHGSSPSTKFGDRRSEDEILVVRHISPAEIAHSSAPVAKSPARLSTNSARVTSTPAPNYRAPPTFNAAAKQQVPGAWPEEDNYYQQPAPRQSPAPSYREQSPSRQSPPPTYREVRAIPVPQYQQTRSRQTVVKQSYLHRKTSSDDVFVVHHPSPMDLYG